MFGNLDLASGSVAVERDPEVDGEVQVVGFTVQYPAGQCVVVTFNLAAVWGGLVAGFRALGLASISPPTRVGNPAKPAAVASRSYDGCGSTDTPP